MRHATIAIALLASSLAHAAEPTTQPQTYPALQKQLARYKAENEVLKAKVDELTKKNADLQKLVDAAATPKAAKVAKLGTPEFPLIKEPEVGMTRTDFNACFDATYKLDEMVKDVNFTTVRVSRDGKVWGSVVFDTVEYDMGKGKTGVGSVTTIKKN